MAVYISIKKVADEPDHADFEFEMLESNGVGLLRVWKESGEIEALRELDPDPKRGFLARARRKLWLHWKAGEYPEQTCWAS